MDEAIASLNGNPRLILDNDAIREPPREFPSEDRGTRQLSLPPSVRTKPCDIRLVPDWLQETSRE
jgi:hypothetical protein